MTKAKECFIIMPITTPENYKERYRDGEDHFTHVLDYLFFPAIKMAGFEPLKPISKGADVIPAEILRNLEAADMVFCDISCINGNVLFEFGIRTAFNKPICLVKDDLLKAEDVPSDIKQVTYKQYDSSLEPWYLQNDIKLIANHIKDSEKKCKGGNPLWKRFAFKLEAIPYDGDTGDNAKLSYLTLQVESMKEMIDKIYENGKYLNEKSFERKIHPKVRLANICDSIRRLLPPNVELKTADGDGYTWVTAILSRGSMVPGDIFDLSGRITQEIKKEYGVELTITFEKPNL